MRCVALLVVSLVLNVPVLLSNILQYLTTATDTDSLMFSSYLGKLHFVMLNSVHHVRCFSSFIYRNSFLVYQNFGRLVEDFSEGNVNLCNSFFDCRHRNAVSPLLILLLHELISSRDGGFVLTRSELQCVMDDVCCICCLLFSCFCVL